IDQRAGAFTLRQRFIEEGANFLVESFLRHWIICLCIFGDVARQGTAFRFPLVATAIENFHFLVSKESERPECVAGPPVGFITIENAGRVWCDAVTAAKLRKFLRRDIV